MELGLSINEIKRRIYPVRGFQVVLDRDLAEFYGVKTKVLNQAVRRNEKRFPNDFMFQLEEEEFQILKLQFGSIGNNKVKNRKYLPLVFTEQGVSMLSSVLSSDRADEVNIAIMRTFVQFRNVMEVQAEYLKRTDSLHTKLDRLEIKLDQLSIQPKPLPSPLDLGHSNQLQSSRYGNPQQRGLRNETIEEIQSGVAGHFNIKTEKLRSKLRTKDFALPRQIAMYLCRKHTSLSFAEIGKYFGGKDHTTVLHAYHKIRKDISRDQNMLSLLNKIENAFTERRH